MTRRLAANRSPQWAFMEKFEVPSFDEPRENYLTRWRLIQTPWFGVYLHRFDHPDSRPTLHDHPWDFVSIVLRGGGYTERRGLGAQRRRVRWVNVARAEDVHYIESLASPVVWTLMLVGRRRRAWGYVDRRSSLGGELPYEYRWTRFDRHPHAVEYDRAMATRAAGTDGGA